MHEAKASTPSARGLSRRMPSNDGRAMAVEDRTREQASPDARFRAKLRELEDDLAGLKGARERMVAAGQRARRQLAEQTEKTASRSSDDGLATVTCDGRGRVREVTLDAARYAKTNERELSEAVLQARQRARAVTGGESKAAKA